LNFSQGPQAPPSARYRCRAWGPGSGRIVAFCQAAGARHVLFRRCLDAAGRGMALGGKRNTLLEKYILLDLKNPRAREFARQGFPRRLKVMVRCITKPANGDGASRRKNRDIKCPPAASRRRCPSKGGAQAGLICYSLFDSGAAPIQFYMGGLHDVAREASFEAKESDESRNGIGSRWGVVAGGRIRGSRWSARRYADGEHGTGNYSW
jgi:hypothetical protein